MGSFLLRRQARSGSTTVLTGRLLSWEEKMEMIRKLEEVNTYLKDALGRGIEF